MITFSIPAKESCDKDFFSFKVETNAVLFAGSRNISIKPYVCHDLVNAFAELGFSFITGCANGVDASFRSALIDSPHNSKAVVACAFREKAEKFKGLFPLFVVPDGLPPKVALAKRTLWMCSRCSLLILFPTDPMGKGSSLAFRTTIYNSKPVFVVSKTKPTESTLYSVHASNLFGVIDGFWCVPPVYADTGLTHETT